MTKPSDLEVLEPQELDELAMMIPRRCRALWKTKVAEILGTTPPPPSTSPTPPTPPSPAPAPAAAAADEKSIDEEPSSKQVCKAYLTLASKPLA